MTEVLTVHDHHDQRRFFTGEDVAVLLNPGDWKVITDEAPQRSARDPEGRPVMIRDTVFRARRGG